MELAWLTNTCALLIRRALFVEKHAESAALFSSFKDDSFHFQLCIQWSDHCDYSHNAEFIRLFSCSFLPPKSQLCIDESISLWNYKRFTPTAAVTAYNPFFFFFLFSVASKLLVLSIRYTAHICSLLINLWCDAIGSLECCIHFVLRMSPRSCSIFTGGLIELPHQCMLLPFIYVC